MSPKKKVDDLLKKVSASIRPTKNEIRRLDKVQVEIEKRLREVLPEDVRIGTFGSVSKGTNLRGNDELDIFMLFSRDQDLENMQELGLDYAKKAASGLKTEKNYAQHPYLKVYLEGVKIDIVPSFSMENEQKIKSAVDRSQLHARWVNSRIDDKKRDDVRLLKQFLKNIGAYGAQLKVEGFSGYLCELLIIRYGSFLKCIKAFSRWQKDMVIDMEGSLGIQEAKKRFADAALIVIDPVDKNRNVAAVVSRTSVSRFIHACREFEKDPSKKHFFKEKEVHSRTKLRDIIKRRESCSIVILFKTPDLVEDILWPQLKKTAYNAIRHLEGNGFRVFGHYYYADDEDALILIELMEKKIPRIKNVYGPQVFDKDNVERFLFTHKDAQNLHFEHDRIVAVEKREFSDANKLIKDWIKRPEAIAKGLFKEVKRGRVVDAYALLEKKNLLQVASDYYSRKV